MNESLPSMSQGAPVKAPRVLCYSPYNLWVLHGVWEMTILHGLKYRGAEVRYVLCDGLYDECDIFTAALRDQRSCERCQARVTQLAGMMKMEYEWLGRYITPEEARAAREWADALHVDAFTNATYKDWPISEWVRSSVHTFFRMSELDFSLPEVQQVYRGHLYSGLVACFALSRLLDDFQPDVLFQFNGRMASTRVAFELARERGIPVVCHERGWLKESMALFENDHCLAIRPLRRAWEAWHNVPLTPSELDTIAGYMAGRQYGKDLSWTAFSPPPQDIDGLYAQLGLEPGRLLWVLFTSSEDELICSEEYQDTFIKQRDWILRTISYAESHPELDLVIRVHPNTGGQKTFASNIGQLREYQELAGHLPANVRMVMPDDPISSYSLMDIGTLGLVYHSTVGLEMACKGKNVIAILSRTRNTPFTQSPNSVEEYDAMLDAARGLPLQFTSLEIQRMAFRFAYTLFFRWNVPFPLVEMLDKYTPKLRYQNLDELAPGNDAALDRVCRVILDGEPVCPPPTDEEVKTRSEADEIDWLKKHVQGKPRAQEQPVQPRGHKERIRILVGPGSFHEFRKNLEEVAEAYDIKCMGDEPGDIPYCFESDDFMDAIARLPQGWEPDFVLWICQYTPIPPGIEKSPYPTVAAVGDWNILFSGLRYDLMRFDWIVTDKAGVEVFRRAGYANVDYWPLFSFQPDIHRRMEGTEHIYDVLMIGNFNHEIQRERAPWLRRVARMNRNRRVRLLTGIYGKDYARALNQARIVFNRSIRGEMNMRAYEAPACGALLFYEEENLEVRDFFQDRVECVLYNDENLEELIEYYLANEDERVRIADAGHRRVQEESQRHHFDRLVALLQEQKVLGGGPRERRFNKLPPQLQAYCRGLQAFETTRPSLDTLALAEREFLSILKEAPGNPGALNALGVLYGHYAGMVSTGVDKSALQEKALHAFTQALQAAPQSGLIHHNLAQLHFGMGHYKEAEEEFLKAIEQLEQGDSITSDDLFLPRSFDLFLVEWQRIGAQFADDPRGENRAYDMLLLWQCRTCLGDIAARCNRFNDALQHLHAALKARPDLSGKLRLKLGDILQILGRGQEALQQYRLGYDEDPFNPTLWKNFTGLLYQLGLFDECSSVCEDLLTIISACPFYEQEAGWLGPLLEESSKRASSRQPGESPQPAPVQQDVGASIPRPRRDPITLPVVWHAPVSDASGYAEDARELVLGLHHAGVPIQVRPIAWNDQRIELYPGDAAVLDELSGASPAAHGIVVQHIFPTFFKESPGAAFLVGRTKFETDRIPVQWVPLCNAMDQVWVPSEFNVETFAWSGVERSRLYKVPQAVDMRRFHAGLVGLELPIRRGFNFLSVFDWGIRKGWDILLRAYIEEFDEKEDVCLFLKVASSAGLTPQQIDQQVQAFIQSELGRDPEHVADVALLHEMLPQAMMPSLYRSVDAYVMPCRAESWGRPFMEAMAAGLPVIGTGWGGHTEFMKPGTAYLIEYELVDVPDDVAAEVPLYKGHRWAAPSVDHLRSLMREVFENREEAEKKGATAREFIAEHFDRIRVVQQLIGHLEAISA